MDRAYLGVDKNGIVCSNWITMAKFSKNKHFRCDDCIIVSIVSHIFRNFLSGISSLSPMYSLPFDWSEITSSGSLLVQCRMSQLLMFC